MPPNKGSISAGTAQKPLPSFRGRMDRARYWRQNHRNHGTGKGEDQFDKISQGERPLQKNTWNRIGRLKRWPRGTRKTSRIWLLRQKRLSRRRSRVDTAVNTGLLRMRMAGFYLAYKAI